MVPAYTLPPNAQHVKIMRALVKETLSREMVDTLAADIARGVPDPGRQGRGPRVRAPARQDLDWILNLAHDPRAIRAALLA